MPRRLMLSRRSLHLSALTLLPLTARAEAQPAARTTIFKIGTGGVNGAYFALGSALASIISEPPGSPACRQGDDCGIENLVATAQTSAGSVANVTDLETGAIESAFVQSDVAFLASQGKRPFGERPLDDLRALAALFSESLHLVLAPRLEASTLTQALRGRRMALDEEGSGTLLQARLLLTALGLSEKDIVPFYIKSGAALSMMRDGKLDGMFVTGGYPMPSVSEAITNLGASLMPITDRTAEAMLKRYPFLTRTVIPASAYGLAEDTASIGVTAQWLVTTRMSDSLAFDLVRALFSKRAMDSLSRAHPRGADITPANAFAGLPVPLHPGALRFYREQGLAPADAR